MLLNFYVSEKGFAYRAQANPGCTGCAFDNDNRGCALSAPCTPSERDDERSIVWVLAEDQS